MTSPLRDGLLHPLKPWPYNIKPWCQIHMYFVIYFSAERNDEVVKSSDDYPAMSTKTNVANRQNYGRHVVATEDVSVGETILAEEPYASVLFPEKSGFNCSHCFKRFKAAIPCTRQEWSKKYSYLNELDWSSKVKFLNIGYWFPK